MCMDINTILQGNLYMSKASMYEHLHVLSNFSFPMCIQCKEIVLQVLQCYMILLYAGTPVLYGFTVARYTSATQTMTVLV